MTACSLPAAISPLPWSPRPPLSNPEGSLTSPAHGGPAPGWGVHLGHQHETEGSQTVLAGTPGVSGWPQEMRGAKEPPDAEGHRAFHGLVYVFHALVCIPHRAHVRATCSGGRGNKTPICISVQTHSGIAEVLLAPPWDLGVFMFHASVSNLTHPAARRGPLGTFQFSRL